MYLTLAVCAATPEACAALTGAAERTDPRVMPIPGPARVAWRAPGGRAAMLHWGDAPSPGSAAERLLRTPQADRQGAWALATLTALLSGDWLNAREPAGEAVSRGRTASRPARSTGRPRRG
jgi:hypothetical protein